MSKSNLTAAERRKIVAKRAFGSCEYCLSQAKFSPDSFAIEHIKPRSSGGTSQLDNLAFSCQGCNNRKYTSTEAIDPVSGQLVPLYSPRQQHRSEHFTWNDDFTLIIGLTPTGRATIDKLQLNREGVVNLRHVLRTVGKHPPTETIS